MAMTPREFTVALDGEGQLTLPAGVRRQLSLERGARLRLRVRDDGTVELSRPPFATIADMAGIGRNARAIDSKDEDLTREYEGRWQAKQERSK